MRFKIDENLPPEASTLLGITDMTRVRFGTKGFKDSLTSLAPLSARKRTGLSLPLISTLQTFAPTRLTNTQVSLSCVSAAKAAPMFCTSYRI